MYSHTAPVYQKVQEKDGTYQLKKVGETDVYKAIQSHRDEVNMSQILKRASVTGDYSQIKGKAGVYADIADMPRCFNDAQKLISSMPQKFADLPAEIKGAFASYADFIDSVANGTVAAKVDTYNIAQAQAAAEKGATAE